MKKFKTLTIIFTILTTIFFTACGRSHHENEKDAGILPSQEEFIPPEEESSKLKIYTGIYKFDSTDIYDIYDNIDTGNYISTKHFTESEASHGNNTALLFILSISEEIQTEDLQVIISYVYNGQEHEYYNGDPSYLLENHNSTLKFFTAPTFTLNISLLESITMRAYYGEEQEAEATITKEESPLKCHTEIWHQEDPLHPYEYYREINNGTFIGKEYFTEEEVLKENAQLLFIFQIPSEIYKEGQELIQNLFLYYKGEESPIEEEHTTTHVLQYGGNGFAYLWVELGPIDFPELKTIKVTATYGKYSTKAIMYNTEYYQK